MYKPTFYWVSCCCYSEFPSSAFFQGYLASLHPGKKNASWKWPKGGRISWFVSIHFPLPWFCGGNETAMPDNVGPLTSAVSAASLAASKLHSAIDILASTMFGPPKRPKSRSFFRDASQIGSCLKPPTPESYHQGLWKLDKSIYDGYWIFSPEILQVLLLITGNAALER